MNNHCQWVLLSALLTAADVAIGCTEIDAVPYTIGASGSYCLSRDLTVDVTQGKPAITVAADSVDLDLRGFALMAEPAGGNGMSHGVVAYAQQDIRIHDGLIHGFYYGVRLMDRMVPLIGFTGESHHHEIRELKISDTGVGIFVTGRESVIAGNVVAGARYAGITYLALAVAASDPDLRKGSGVVVRNEVFEVNAPMGYGDAVSAIHVASYKGDVRDNQVDKFSGPAGSSAMRISGESTMVSGNRQTNFGAASAILCTSPSNLVQNNLSDVANAVVGCSVQ